MNGNVTRASIVNWKNQKGKFVPFEFEHLVQPIATALQARNWLLVTAESCTGGWLGQVLTTFPGSSKWFERGFITYSNPAKQEMLGVQAETLRQHGAVSEATAHEMAKGALLHSHGQVSVAITGIAGPSSDQDRKAVGTVWIAISAPGLATTAIHSYHFSGDRQAIRYQAVQCALEQLLTILTSPP